MHGIEGVVLNNHDYTGASAITDLSDAMLNAMTDTHSGAGTFTLDGTHLAAGQTLTVDAQGVTTACKLVVSGGADADTVTAGLGDETIHGGSGNDSLAYSAFSTDYRLTINMATGSTTGTHSGSAMGFSHSFDGIESVTGGLGDDTVVGGLSGATLAGGGGTDTLSYSSAGAAVTVNLATGTATDGSTTDHFSGFASYVGSASSSDILRYADTADTAEMAHYSSFETIVFTNTTTSVSETVTNANNTLFQAGATLTVDATSLTTGTLTFDASGVTSGCLNISGGAANYVIKGVATTGYAGYASTLFGGAGEDTLTGSAGQADLFLYKATTDGVTNGDTITNYETGTDKLAFGDGPFGYTSASHAGYATATEAAQARVFAGDGTASLAAYNASTSTDACWYLSGTTLMYDADGHGDGATTGTGAAVAIATGIASIATTDIVIVDATHSTV